MGTYTPALLLDMVTLLAIASAIALFGSYKLSELHQEAARARRLQPGRPYPLIRIPSRIFRAVSHREPRLLLRLR